MTDSPFTISKVATSSAEKRAISYASTIFNLFDSVLTTKQPADRIIANYFREHKKHGSKDRRVIRVYFVGGAGSNNLVNTNNKKLFLAC
jgi:hypothetical protein